MSILTLLCLTVFGGVGVIYIYSGKVNNNRLLLWCGIALTLLPLILSRLILLVAVETVLAATPVLAPRIAAWFRR